MKRLSGLYERIISISNLIEADRKARMGKLRSYGVRKHDKRRGCNIISLHNELAEKRFKTSQYTVFTIHEPKAREIYRLPYFPDRIVHHAVMNVMEPVWVSIFTEDTFACIKHRGIHRGAKRLTHDLRRDRANTTYCLKFDIKKFYPSIDHDVLKSILRRKIKDRDALNLLDGIIDTAPGVPIGNYLSQYFANLYMAYFDHWIKEEKKVKYYYRYADDVVILGSSKQQLHRLMNAIRLYLEDRLNLTVKENYQVFPVSCRGIDFLGYVFFHTHTLLRKSIKKNFARKVSRMRKRGRVNISTVSSYYGWAKHCNAKNLLKTLLNDIDHEIKQSA